MKPTYIIYYGNDGTNAKTVAKAMRADGFSIRVYHAEVWSGHPDSCDFVTILPCVSGHDVARIRAAYGDKVVGARPAEPVIPPPIPAPVAVPVPDVPVILPPAPVPAFPLVKEV